MQQHPTLLLNQRYPELYGLNDGRYLFQFAHDDGWFAILDALSEVLVRQAVTDDRPPQRVMQVKEKIGTLRFYFGWAVANHGEADDGAVAMAEEMSGRLCEVTGRPGRLGSRRGWRATRAPGLDGIEFAETEEKHGWMFVPPLGLTAADVCSAAIRMGLRGDQDGHAIALGRMIVAGDCRWQGSYGDDVLILMLGPVLGMPAAA